MTEDASEEAAWRDLVAHYATPAVADGVPAPWPTREDLPGPALKGQEPAGPLASVSAACWPCGAGPGRSSLVGQGAGTPSAAAGEA